MQRRGREENGRMGCEIKQHGCYLKISAMMVYITLRQGSNRCGPAAGAKIDARFIHWQDHLKNITGGACRIPSQYNFIIRCEYFIRVPAVECSKLI